MEKAKWYEPAFLVPATDHDARNRAIMVARLENRIAELDAMFDANKAWRERMWRTPDVAPCLGRYMMTERKQ